MKDECLLIFANKTKEMSIGLNNKGKYIFTDYGSLVRDRTTLEKGRIYKIDGVVYRFIGYECNKIINTMQPVRKSVRFLNTKSKANNANKTSKSKKIRKGETFNSASNVLKFIKQNWSKMI